MLAVRHLLLFFCLSINLVQLSYAAEIQTLEQAEQALSRLNPLIAKNPKSADYYVERGDVYYAMNDMPRAIDDYSRVIKLDSTRDQAYFGRGMALGRTGRIEKALPTSRSTLSGILTAPSLTQSAACAISGKATCRQPSAT